MAFVVDCSLTLIWCFPDEATRYSEALLDRLGAEGAFASMIWPLELANGLLVGERRKRISPADMIGLKRVLRDLPIEVDLGPDGQRLLTNVLDVVHSLAQTYNLSAYDASYLEVALRRDLPLATLDGRLRSAAEQAGVALL